MESIPKETIIEIPADELAAIIASLRSDYETHLKPFGVLLPSTDSNALLWLVLLKRYQGKLVHKDTISAFVERTAAHSGKDQQVRHLAGKYGWYVLNKGDKVPNEDQLVPNGWHVLITSESPKPNFLFKALKRVGRIGARDFAALKAAYGFRCATCGSIEGKPHLLDPDQRTQLQQGHMNPRLPLTIDNTIPQCQLCNRVYQDDFVFDEKGRTVAVASTRPVLRADQATQDEIRKALGGSIE